MILQLDTIRNERGVTLVATIILLFFVSIFLFSIVMWHDSLYRNFNSLEIYYEKQTVDYMNRINEEQHAEEILANPAYMTSEKMELHKGFLED